MRLKAALFPYDDLDIHTGLGALAKAGLIVRYDIKGRKLVAIPTWAKHQQPHIRESVSELQPPDAGTVLAPVEPTGSGKGADQEGKGTVGSAVTLRDTTPAVLVFPTVGSGAKTWALTEAKCAEWSTDYPGLDVLGECRKARAWVHANQPKTARGMPAFLVGWFNRAVQRGEHVTRPLGSAVAPARAAWRDECHALGHDPTCSSPERHALRLEVTERGCDHPGVCRSLGECLIRNQQVVI